MQRGRVFLAAGALAALISGCIPGPQRPAPAAPPPAAPPLPVPARLPLPALPQPGLQPGFAPRIVAAARHIVQPGETLRGIGNLTGAGSDAIARANGLVPPFIIRPGQALAIPPGRYHLVEAGQTGLAIARAYRADWRALVAENALAPPYVLRAGQRLRLPDGAGIAGAPPPPPPGDDGLIARARAFTLAMDDVVTGSQPALAATPVALPARTGPFDGRFDWPVAGRLIGRFGAAGTGKRLDGIKLAAAIGTPVLAGAPGTILYAGDEIDVLGGVVLVDHGSGWISAYGHLSEIGVVPGDRVAAGGRLGAVGDTGYVTEPQLHFELRQNRQPVDPVKRLPPR